MILLFSKIFNYLIDPLYHSHKKRKDILETQAKRTVLRPHVENQDILEPILLYPASKYKQTKCRAIKTVCELPFYLSMSLILGFFLSSVKIQTCQDQTFTKNCCSSSKKEISTISNIEWRAELVDH